MRRSILTWRILSDNLIGTYHIPATAEEGYFSTHEIGVLLLNSGPAPRAGNCDLSAHIADRLACLGIPAFRFDLPGLGDSFGSTPPEFASYWHEVVRGRNNAVTLELAIKLKQEFGISKLIVGGLCAAAVPTLSTADNDGVSIAGIILMEPNLCLSENANPSSSKTKVSSDKFTKVKETLRKICSIRDWLLFLTGNSRITRLHRSIRPILVRVQKLLIGHTLPRDMNTPLFLHWQGSIARGTHSLIVIAEGQGNDRYVAHALDSLPSDGPGVLTLVSVPQTNHILTSGHARNIVLDAVEQWCIKLKTQHISK